MTAVRRGLTLIEVLASLVLLSLIASACIPLLQRSMRIAGNSSQDQPGFEIELARLADSMFEKPSEFGISEIEKLENALIGWPDDPARGQVLVERLAAAEKLSAEEDVKRVQGSWLRISYSGAAIYRWIPAMEKGPEQEARGRQ